MVAPWPALNPINLTSTSKIVYGLTEIQNLNANRAYARLQNDNFTRRASICASRGGYVLHSATLRSTCYCGPEWSEDITPLKRWENSLPVLFDAWVDAVVSNLRERAAWRVAIQKQFGGRVTPSGPGVGHNGWTWSAPDRLAPYCESPTPWGLVERLLLAMPQAGHVDGRRA